MDDAEDTAVAAEHVRGAEVAAEQHWDEVERADPREDGFCLLVVSRVQEW